ncbi:MAG: SPOR domain-containing protein [Holosporaceae bacterium]|jgi:cell division septation protein DedD|nr:SPOR domain-containing protein [Holosporaceae bacterium]
MCPFVNEDENDDDYVMPITPTSEDNIGFRSQFFKNDKKFFLIGGGASAIAFILVAYLIYSNSRPINLEELPIIGVDDAPLKIKPETNAQVEHQDKTVYDNISGQQREIEEKIAPPVEEVLSIPEADVGESMSEEEKKDIIRAFDDLAPEKEYRIQYVKKGVTKAKSSDLIIVEEENRPPIKKLEEKKPPTSALKSKERIEKSKLDLPRRSAIVSGGMMVQIASVATKSAAETEYSRILSRNKFLRGLGKKIVKVDLGEKKGVKYRIQVGPFKKRVEADRIVSKMKKNGFPAYISK